MSNAAEARGLKRPRFPLTANQLNVAGVVGGLMVGYALGPTGAVLKPVADAYVLLLEMIVIPLLVLSIIHGLGQLTPRQMASMVRIAALALLSVWAVSLGTIYTVSLALPLGNSSFYSDTERATPLPSSLLGMLIPENPFKALADGVIPGIVFFCLLFAWQLAHSTPKERLLEALEGAWNAVLGIARLVNNLSPIGLFALIVSAIASGRLDAAAVGIYGPLCLIVIGVLALWLLPVLVHVTTDVSYMRLMREAWPVMLTAFLSASLFAALPLITRAVEALHVGGEEEKRDATTFVAVAYSLPNASTMLVIFFTIFAAAAYGVRPTLGDHLRLLTVGVFSLIGGPVAGVRTTLELLHVPHDAIGLFFSIGSVLTQFREVLSVMSLLAAAVWVDRGMSGGLRISALRVLACIGLTLLPLGVASEMLGHRLSFPPGNVAYYAEMPAPEAVRVVEDVPRETSPPSGVARLRRGEPLRVGVLGRHVPYGYRNARGELTGFHVELAALLSRDLPGRVVLVETDPARLDRDLSSGRIDVMLAPVTVTTERLLALNFTEAALSTRLVLLVADARAEQFAKRVAEKRWDGMKVGAYPSIAGSLAHALVPGAQVIPVDAAEPLQAGAVDAVLCNEIEAASWCVTHPAFDRLPVPESPVVNLAYPVRQGDEPLATFLDSWLEIQKANGVLERLMDKWVRGRKPAQASGS